MFEAQFMKKVSNTGVSRKKALFIKNLGLFLLTETKDTSVSFTFNDTTGRKVCFTQFGVRVY